MASGRAPLGAQAARQAGGEQRDADPGGDRRESERELLDAAEPAGQQRERRADDGQVAAVDREAGEEVLHVAGLKRPVGRIGFDREVAPVSLPGGVPDERRGRGEGDEQQQPVPGPRRAVASGEGAHTLGIGRRRGAL